MGTEMRTGRVRSSIRALVAPFVLTAGIVAVTGAYPAVASASLAHKTHPPKFVIKSESQPGLGTVLTTPGGFTLYVYTGDTQNNSVESTLPTFPFWPALTLPSGYVLNPVRGIVGLGTYQLPNGQTQITWQGLPLYTFVRDTAPNVVSGQGKAGFVVAFVQLQR